MPAKYTGVRIEIQQNQWLTPFNTFGLAVRARYLLVARSIEEISAGVRFARDNKLRLTVLGGGSNVVLRGDHGGLVLRVAISGIRFEGDRVVAGAGENWHGLVMSTVEAGLSGIENLALIPGSAGAAPIQNIGAYGMELADVFESLTALDLKSLVPRQFSAAELSFGYRDSAFKHALAGRFVITALTLKLSRQFEPNLTYDALREEAAASGEPLSAAHMANLVAGIRRRKLPDPDKVGNVGSFFKNPVVSDSRLRALRAQFPAMPYWATDQGNKVSAGWLIESCGLKGYRIGDAGVSANHALVLVNHGGATPGDVLALAELIVRRVREEFDLSIEIEPSLV